MKILTYITVILSLFNNLARIVIPSGAEESLYTNKINPAAHFARRDFKKIS